ncbi:hypothetical protein [Pedobacter sp. KLB.chiD]|uniref:hypothetical protein n=1 Tax=Pedobacter sp. KLB.chiD TaxID=3387402 RepID=UPI00399A131B
MKIILIATLLSCLSIFRQEEPLSRIANVELPHKSQRINNNNLPAEAKSRFKSTMAISQYKH